MPDRFGRYTPPKSGDLGKEGKDVLSKVYSACRRANPGEIQARKAKCAKIAWGAVKRAGYR